MKRLRCTACRSDDLRATSHAGVFACPSCRAEAEGPIRIGCCVPFCHRTRGTRKGEKPMVRGASYRWMCGRHWMALPRRMRALVRCNDRRVARVLAARPIYAEWWKLKGGSPGRLRAIAMWQRRDQIWERCVAAAVELGGGI